MRFQWISLLELWKKYLVLYTDEKMEAEKMHHNKKKRSGWNDGNTVVQNVSQKRLFKIRRQVVLSLAEKHNLVFLLEMCSTMILYMQVICTRPISSLKIIRGFTNGKVVLGGKREDVNRKWNWTENSCVETKFPQQKSFYRFPSLSLVVSLCEWTPLNLHFYKQLYTNIKP